jgi:Flp pilus assembly protein TadG
MPLSRRCLRHDRSGIAIIEFALILPVLLLLLLGVLEFGVYFVKSQFVQRTVSGIANSVQLNALDSVNIRSTAYNSSGSMFTYNDTVDAFFCAKAYGDLATAQSGMCVQNEWFLDKPAGVTGNTYYVAIQSSVKQNSITPMFASFLPPMKATAVVQVGAGVTSQVHGIVKLTGSGSWTVPAGVTQIKATVVGAGGGGAPTPGGWGGSSGSIVIAYINNLNSGMSLSYSVGAGGGQFLDGASTTFNNIVAGGGRGSSSGYAPPGTSNTSQTVSSGNLTSFAVFIGDSDAYGGGTGYLGTGSGGIPYSPYNIGRDGAVIIEW